MTILSMILTLLIIIPVVPLIVYIAGLIVPATHIVSRSSTFKISSMKLWSILTDVSKYPEWQHKVQEVVIDEIDINANENKKVIFVEYSTRKRKTLVINQELVPFRSLIRVLEETPSSIISDKYQFKKKTPTFSGSWTFDILQDRELESNQVTLKITEQGVIKKPFARIMHLLLLGYHYRIDRFLRDLNILVDKENQKWLSTDSANDKKQQDSNKKSVRFEGIIATSEMNGVLFKEKTSGTLLNQVAEANDNSMIKSKETNSKNGEWDMARTK